MSDVPPDDVDPAWWDVARVRPPLDLGLRPPPPATNDVRLLPEPWPATWPAHDVNVHVLVEQPPHRPRRHGAAWWLLVGWWWRPACWCGRVLLWLVCWPLGLWRSIRHGQRRRR